MARADADLLGLPPEDMPRPPVAIANPLSEDEPLLRTTLLPDCCASWPGTSDGVSPTPRCTRSAWSSGPRPGAAPQAPILAVDRGPTVAELATLEAALPDQPQHLAAVLAGRGELDGWW